MDSPVSRMVTGLKGRRMDVYMKDEQVEWWADGRVSDMNVSVHDWLVACRNGSGDKWVDPIMADAWTSKRKLSSPTLSDLP